MSGVDPNGRTVTRIIGLLNDPVHPADAQPMQIPASARSIDGLFTDRRSPDKRMETLQLVLRAVSDIRFEKEEHSGDQTWYRTSFIFDDPPLSQEIYGSNFNNHTGQSDYATVKDALSDLFITEKKISANIHGEPHYIVSPEIPYKAQRISFMIPEKNWGDVMNAQALVTGLIEAKQALGDAS